MKKKFLLITGGTILILAAIFVLNRIFGSAQRFKDIAFIIYGYLIGYFSAWFYVWFYGYRKQKKE